MNRLLPPLAVLLAFALPAAADEGYPNDFPGNHPCLSGFLRPDLP